MLARADYAPPFEFYAHALTALGKKRELLARLGPESADAIEEFLSLALAYERGAHAVAGRFPATGWRAATPRSSATWSAAATKCG